MWAYGLQRSIAGKDSRLLVSANIRNVYGSRSDGTDFHEYDENGSLR